MKTITLRLSEDEYSKILASAMYERRPISNFITFKILKTVEESYFTSAIETDQTKSDKKLLARLKRGHGEAKKMKGRFVD